MKKTWWEKKDVPNQKERVEELIKKLEEGVANFSYSVVFPLSIVS